MTDTIYGLIEGLAVKEAIGKTGKPYKLWQYEINQKKYSTFNIDIGSKFKVGDYVKMTGLSDGKFWSMKTMELTEKAEFPITSQSNSTLESDLLRKILAEITTLNQNFVAYRGEIENGNIKDQTIKD